LITWITATLGTAAYNTLPDGGEYGIVDVRDLVDRGGNPPSLVAEKIEQALSHLERGQKVVICCDYGVSRSNAIAAGVLARTKSFEWHEAVREVVSRTGQRGISLAVLSVVRQVVESGEARVNSQPVKSSRRILVTGATGLIGSSLVPRLASRHAVVAPSREALNIVEGSIDLDLMVKEHAIECIVHLANPRIYTTSTSVGETLVMLRHVLEVCRENHLKLVYLSSWEVYSGYREAKLASEQLPPLPKSSYGQTKFLCETLIELYRNLHDVKRWLLRASPVYGEASDKPKFIRTFLHKALRNEDIVTHRYENGFPHLDLVYVDDVVSAIVACVESEVSDSLNIGTGVRTSTAQIAELIREMVGSSSKIVHRTIADFAPNIAMDTRRAAEVVGWRPLVELHEGLRRLLEPAMNAR